MSEGLVGRSLALAAHSFCRAADPVQSGLRNAEIERILDAAGVVVGGNVPRQVLSTALNGSQDLFVMAPGDTWRWIEAVPPRGAGLSGQALAEEAYRIAMREDPGQDGLHYEIIKSFLIDDGVTIRGTNHGKTVFRSLQLADRWFEWISSGKFRWKL